MQQQQQQQQQNKKNEKFLSTIQKYVNIISMKKIQEKTKLNQKIAEKVS